MSTFITQTEDFIEIPNVEEKGEHISPLYEMVDGCRAYYSVNMLMCSYFYEDVVISAMTCDCCERHTTNRPILRNFYDWFDGIYTEPSHKKCDKNPDCECNCRSMSRIACYEHVRTMEYLKDVITNNKNQMIKCNCLDEMNIDKDFVYDRCASCSQQYMIDDYKEYTESDDSVKEELSFLVYFDEIVYKITLKYDSNDKLENTITDEYSSLGFTFTSGKYCHCSQKEIDDYYW